MLETNALVRRLSINNSKLLTLSDENIKDIQAVLLDMMADFDAFCRKNGLSYFLCGGSALGAQRHGGFIPWDDDMDVAMPRADYDRMRDLFLAEYGDRYWVQALNDGGNYDLPFMKLAKKAPAMSKFLKPISTKRAYSSIFIRLKTCRTRRLCGLCTVLFVIFCIFAVRASGSNKKSKSTWNTLAICARSKSKPFSVTS